MKIFVLSRLKCAESCGHHSEIQSESAALWLWIPLEIKFYDLCPSVQVHPSSMFSFHGWILKKKNSNLAPFCLRRVPAPSLPNKKIDRRRHFRRCHRCTSDNICPSFVTSITKNKQMISSSSPLCQHLDESHIELFIRKNSILLGNV